MCPLLSRNCCALPVSRNAVFLLLFSLPAWRLEKEDLWLVALGSNTLTALCQSRSPGGFPLMSESDSYLLVSGVLRSYPQYAKSGLDHLVETVIMFVQAFLILSYHSHRGHEAICAPSKPRWGLFTHFRQLSANWIIVTVVVDEVS